MYGSVANEPLNVLYNLSLLWSHPSGPILDWLILSRKKRSNLLHNSFPIKLKKCKDYLEHYFELIIIIIIGLFFLVIRYTDSRYEQNNW